MKKAIKSKNLLPSHLQPSYLPKIRVFDDHGRPMKRKHIVRSLMIAFSLILTARAAANKKRANK
jgi:hypothetical protein